jgi:hypothetical protein
LVPPFPLSAGLPERLVVEGEFGAEVNSFVPFVYWLHLTGLMRGRQVCTYAGMRPFYFFLADGEIAEEARPRRYVPPPARPAWLPNRDDHAARRTGFEVFPDYRRHFRDGAFAGDKPLLVIHNKATAEWSGPPVNVIPLPILDRLFGALTGRFRVVYLRPGIHGTPCGYSADHQPDLPFDDLAVLQRHPEVVLFDEIAAERAGRTGYNETKLRLYAHADFHITVQGGNAHLLTMFPGGMVAILHRLGQEIRHSYRDGPFGYAAAPRPRWLICRNPDELLVTIPLFRDAVMADGQALLPPWHCHALRMLSPAAQCGDDRMMPDDLKAKPPVPFSV